MTFWQHCVSDWSNFRRALCLFAVMAMIAIVSTWIALTLLLPAFHRAGRVQIKFIEGATIVSLGETITGQLMLPASADWQDLGLELARGDSIQLSASGAVHLAVQGLQTAARENRPPDFDWVSPSGELWRVARPRDHGRERLLVDSQIAPGDVAPRIGCVLAVLVPEGVRPTILNGRSPGYRTYRIGEGPIVIRNESLEAARVFVIVNDLVIQPDDESRSLFLGPIPNLVTVTASSETFDEEQQGYQERQESWQAHWNQVAFRRIYYDDNVGAFFIQFRVGG